MSSNVPNIICLHANGSIHSFKLSHKKVYTYFAGDSITFCGAITQLNVVAICRKEHHTEDKLNTFSIQFTDFFDKIYGDILLIGSDSEGNECDIDIEAVKKLLNTEKQG